MGANSAKEKKYRERAAEIRAIAEDVRGEDSRKLLLTVARDYEEMADGSRKKTAAKR
jgi:hypothetical protein